jgi:transcription elongation factor Elf1
MATFFGGIPTCPVCKTEIIFIGVEDNKEIYTCKCGLCEEEKPEVKN